MNAPVRIENRSQLIYLLTEAAELEHVVMCSYLFAAFSIKQDVNEGITQKQLGIVRRWRGTILQIAIQEQVHMSATCAPAHRGRRRASPASAEPSHEPEGIPGVL